jgi:hypothetical protein
MSVWKTTDYFEGFGAGHIGFALDGAPDQLNDVWRKMRDIPKGLVFDLTVLAVGAAQQVSLIDLALAGTLDAGYVDWLTFPLHTWYIIS